MRRVLGYASRYLIIKNGVLGVGCIKLSLVFALLISSCALVSHDYIGTWNRQPDKLTYVNYDQHIKLTFPNGDGIFGGSWKVWKVYTKPPLGALGKHWKRPTKADPSYTVMMAIIKRPRVMMQVMIDPAPTDISLDEYLAVYWQGINETQKETISKEIIDSEVSNDRTIGLFSVLARDEAAGTAKFVFAIFKEEGRFTTLLFGCPEKIFGLYNDQFRAIIHLYEYID